MIGRNQWGATGLLPSSEIFKNMLLSTTSYNRFSSEIVQQHVTIISPPYQLVAVVPSPVATGRL